MPCDCGQKVERAQTKVQCAKCKEFSHLTCVGMVQADLDFLQTSNKVFVCKVCTAERRGSIRTPPPPAAAEERANAKTAITAANTSVNVLNERANKQQISLMSIADEIAALRADNVNVFSMLNTLLDEKKQLVQKSDSMHAEIVTLRSHLGEKDIAISLLTAEIKKLHELISKNLNSVCTNKSIPSNQCSSPSKSHNAISVTPGETNSLVSASHSYATVGAATLSAGTYSAAVTNAATVKLTPIATAAATTSVLPLSLSTNKVTAMSTSLTPTSNRLQLEVPAQLAVTDVSNGANLNSPNSNRTHEWKTVTRANRKKLKQPLVIGSNNNNELSVVPNMKWLHISSFSNTVTVADVVDYIAKYAEIDKKFLSCYMLIKKDAPLKDFKKINFKLGVSECYYDKLLNADIWPTNVRIRPFSFFQKDVAPPQVP